MALKDIPGYEGFYAASEDGEIWSYRSKKFLCCFINRSGYSIITLSVAGRPKTHYVHRLVASAWIPNPDNLPEVDHLNMNTIDNRVENLQWVSKEENMARVKDSGARNAHMENMRRAKRSHENTYKVYQNGKCVYRTHNMEEVAKYIGVNNLSVYRAYTSGNEIKGYTVKKEVNELAKLGINISIENTTNSLVKRAI